MSALIAVLGGWRASLFALIAVLALAFAGVQTVRVADLRSDLAGSEAKATAALAAASEAARLEEQTRARYIAGIGAAYEEGKRYAEAKGQQVAADLRDGRLRFKRLWEGCAADAPAVPAATANSGQPDAGAAGRADSAGRIVRATEQDAAQIRCLQALALIDRGMDPGDLATGCPVVEAGAIR